MTFLFLMGRLSINSKEFKRFHQERLDEKKYIAKKKIQEENELLREKIIQKEVEEDFKKYKYDWKKELLREFGEWAPIETSGPTNSTSTTFGYFAGGSPVINFETGQQVTFTYSGLDGVENYPTSITIDQGGGDTFQTAPPPFSAIGVQGYTAKLNPRYKEAQEKYKAELKEWERKKEQQQKNIEATLKSFGTSWEAVRAGRGIVKVGRSYVALLNTNPRDFGSNLNNNVRVVRMVPCDPSKPMTLQRPAMVNGVKVAWHLTNAQYSDDVYLQIGQPPEPPMEQEYLMPRRTYFTDVNPQLDASQEFAQRVGADEFMNARVQDVPEQPSFFDYDPYAIKEPVVTPQDVVTPEDEAFIDYMERYPNLVNFLLPGQAAPATSVIDYARGNYRNITQSPGRSANQSILNIISRIHKPGQRGGSVTAGLNPGGPPSNINTAYPTDPVNAVLDAPMRNFLNQFNYEVTSNGVRIIDTFNFNGNRNTGGLANVPIKGPDGRWTNIDTVAKRLAAIGDKRARSMGLNPSDDSLGGKIDFTIPWSEVPAKIQNQLDPTQTISPIVKINRRGRKVNR